MKFKLPRESEEENPNWNYRYEIKGHVEGYLDVPRTTRKIRIVAYNNDDAIFRANSANIAVTYLRLLGKTREPVTGRSAI